MYSVSLFIKEYQEPILLIGEIMVKYVSYPRSNHVQNISAESKYFVTFQNKISICPTYSPTHEHRTTHFGMLIPRGRYESEVGSRDSRAREQKEAERVIERQEQEAERKKRVEIVRLLRAVQSSMEAARARERDGVLTGGPACSLDGSDGHGVHQRPRVGTAVQVQQITTGWPHGAKRRNRGINKGRKPKKSPGNERRSERGGVSLSGLGGSELH